MTEATLASFEGIEISTGSIACIASACLILFAIPVLFWLVWRKNHKASISFRYLLAGAVGFIVSARVLELGVHYFCILADNPVSRFINGNTAAYVIYGITMAGVFEECGRYIILKYIVKKDRTAPNAVMYGIGHGGIEVWAVILPSLILYLVIGILFSSGKIPEALSALNITEETAAAALPTVKAAATFGIEELAVNVLERVFAMLVHIGLTVVVFYGVRKKERKYLLLAILLHMVVDTFPALYQRNVVSIWVCELWVVAWTAVIFLVARKLYIKSSGTAASDENS